VLDRSDVRFPEVISVTRRRDGKIADRRGVRELTVGKAAWCESDIVRRYSHGPFHADQLIPVVP
jgi:hypothetical protein